MSELIHLSARILNTALLLETAYACTAISGIANRLGVVALQGGDQHSECSADGNAGS